MTSKYMERTDELFEAVAGAIDDSKIDPNIVDLPVPDIAKNASSIAELLYLLCGYMMAVDMHELEGDAVAQTSTNEAAPN